MSSAKFFTDLFLAYNSSSVVDGRFDDDTLEARDMFGDMWDELAENRQKWGCRSITWPIPACRNEVLISHQSSWQNRYTPLNRFGEYQHHGLDFLLAES